MIYIVGKEITKNNTRSTFKTGFCEDELDRIEIGDISITLDRLRELAKDEAEGRSTGYLDRNGTPIREHDVVRVTFLDRNLRKEYVREECEVIFSQGAFGFMWGNRKEFSPLCSFLVGTVVFFEVIGHSALAEKG
jgi:hypothetical protein